MRKRIIAPDQKDSNLHEDQWLNLDEIAEVEISSEDAAHPIEHALLPDNDSGWRAAGPGQQTIRLLFANPQPLRRILVNFVETATERTQEYVLRWSADGGRTLREIVRQRWNFSPEGATSETEEHHIDLPSVTVLELSIIPEIGGGEAIASLAKLRLA